VQRRYLVRPLGEDVYERGDERRRGVRRARLAVLSLNRIAKIGIVVERPVAPARQTAEA
jgi:hypothetical protein